MKQELTCIVCPVGCQLTVELENGKVLSVTGNTCKRGETYANNECTNPVRVVTSTIKTSDGIIIPVKTDTAIPKAKVAECMDVINSLHPISNDVLTTGSIVCENILDTSANLITTAPVRR